MYDKATIFTYVAKYIYLRTYNDEIDIIEGMVHFTILNSLTLSKYIRRFVNVFLYMNGQTSVDFNC